MTTQNTDNLDIKIGSAVQCRDGRAGRVIKLVVAPGSKRVTHLVVERGLLLRRDVVVPIERAVRTDGETVELDMSADDLNSLPEYAEVDFVQPDTTLAASYGHPREETLVSLRSYTPTGLPLVSSWSGLVQVHTHTGVPEEATPLGRGTRVSCRDGRMGRLDHVLLDPESGAVRALVVRKGHLLTKDVIVPADWIETVTEEEIVLAADRALLEKLPEYRPARSDSEIAADVEQALAADTRTRQETKIDVRAEEGVVHLGGTVGTEQARQAATEVAGAVAGVWEVETGGLLAESAVATAVSEALARDPRTAQAAIDVSYLGGSVTLRGTVRTAAEKAAAVEIARGVPGVGAVIDELEVQAGATRKSWPAAAAESLRVAAGSLGALRRP